MLDLIGSLEFGCGLPGFAIEVFDNPVLGTSLGGTGNVLDVSLGAGRNIGAGVESEEPVVAGPRAGDIRMSGVTHDTLELVIGIEGSLVDRHICYGTAIGVVGQDLKLTVAGLLVSHAGLAAEHICIFGHIGGAELPLCLIGGIVETEVEVLVLDCGIYVGIDVLVEDVLVDSHKHEEFAHRSNITYIVLACGILEVEGTGAGAEFLEIADHSERAAVSAGLDEGTDNVPGTDLQDEVDIDSLNILAADLHEVAAFIPGVLAPLIVSGSLGNIECGESLAISKGVCLIAVIHAIEESLSLAGAHLEQTADSDFPSLGSGILGLAYYNAPRLVKGGIILVAAELVVIAAGVADDRKEMDVLPRAFLAVAVADTIGIDVTDSLLPNRQTLHEFLCKELEGGFRSGVDTEEFGADDFGACEGISLVEVVVQQVLEEECEGKECTAGAEATAIVGNAVVLTRIAAEVGDILAVAEVHGTLCPVVEDLHLNLSVDLVVAVLLVEVSAVAGLDQRAAPRILVGRRNLGSAHCHRGGGRYVAEAVLLGLKSVETTEEQEAAECSLEHVSGVVRLVAKHDGGSCRDVVGILDHVRVRGLCKLPGGEAVDGAYVAFPDLDDLHILLGEVENGGLCIGSGFQTEELGAEYGVVCKVVRPLEAVLKHILEEECVGEECTAGAEASTVSGDVVVLTRISAEVGDILTMLEVDGTLCPVVQHEEFDLSVDLLVAVLLVEVAAVAALDQRAAP